MISDAQIRHEILTQVRQRGVEKTICPSEVARFLETGNWRALMPRVRAVGSNLAAIGLIAVTQKGQIVDPDTAKGAIRYRVTPQGLNISGDVILTDPR